MTMVGRKAIYRGKKHRYQGLVTKYGHKAFEAARAALAALHQRKPEEVSDGDTMEFLARTRK